METIAGNGNCVVDEKPAEVAALIERYASARTRYRHSAYQTVASDRQPAGHAPGGDELSDRTCSRTTHGQEDAGVILMITATPARMAWPPTGSFGIGGAAIEGRCRSLASELSPQGVRVFCLCSAGSPESFADELNDSFGKAREEMTAMISKETLLKRAPLLAEVGNVAVLMASDYASPMTGTVANMTCGSIVD